MTLLAEDLPNPQNEEHKDLCSRLHDEMVKVFTRYNLSQEVDGYRYETLIDRLLTALAIAEQSHSLRQPWAVHPLYQERPRPWNAE